MQDSLNKNLGQKLKIGDVILVHENGFLHAFTRILIKSYFHHAALYLGNGQFLENTPRLGCHITTLGTLKLNKKHFEILRYKNVNNGDLEKIINYAQSQFLDKKFSRLHFLFARFNHQKSNNHRVCSNIVALAFEHYGYPISDSIPAKYVMPNDLNISERFSKVFEYGKNEQKPAS